MRVDRAEILTSCASPGDFPPPGPPEVAFLGRSNVGKSSLLNKLVRRKKLARTSSTPGKTRLIHFFTIEGTGPDLRMADLPGYGYAKVSRTERKSWQVLIESYLSNRTPLRAAVLLQDVRRDVTEDETKLIDWLTERGIACLVAITKTDKLKPMRRAKRIREIKAQLELPKECVIATSAQTGDGMPDLWRAILDRVEGN
jgi:GTP-binding protein